MEKIIPYKRRPCKNCPFRKDCMKGWLGEEKMKEIVSANSFICHKTNKGDDKDMLQCAGHMILTGNTNMFVRVANILNIELDLSGRELVFTNRTKCVEHHKIELG